MPILRHVPDDTPLRPDILIVKDVPGFEAGRILHGGTCLLRGHVQQGGAFGPTCTDACTGPTPPILLEVIHKGVVLDVDTTDHVATIWDTKRKRPLQIPLADDGVFRARAFVDATEDVARHYEQWRFDRALAEERAERIQAAKQADIDAARDLWNEENARKNADLWAAQAAAAEEEYARQQQRAMHSASVIRRRSRVRIVCDPPGFAARMARIKPRNRIPSSVGIEGMCTTSPLDGPHVFVRADDGIMHRVLLMQLRVVFPDGTLGVEDIPPKFWP